MTRSGSRGSPIRDTLSEGFSHFVTSMTAPVASGWSDGRVGLAPTGKASPYHGAHPKPTSACICLMPAMSTFDSRTCYRFRLVGGTIWEISVHGGLLPWNMIGQFDACLAALGLRWPRFVFSQAFTPGRVCRRSQLSRPKHWIDQRSAWFLLVAARWELRMSASLRF